MIKMIQKPISISVNIHNYEKEKGLNYVIRSIDTVESIKKDIEMNEGIRFEDQVLVYGNKMLNDSKKIQ